MKKYWQIYKMRLESTFIYRGSVVLFRLSNIILLITLLAVWFAADFKDLIGGYTKDGLITYYIFGSLLNSIVFWHSTPGIREEIVEGKIGAKAISKPISYYWLKFFEEFGWHTISPLFGIGSLLLVAVFVGSHIQFSITLQMIPLLIVSIVLSSVLFFNLSCCMGLLSFWLTETEGLTSFVWMGVFLLGGQSIPLSFFPTGIKTIIDLLPFRYMFSYPLEIYAGNLNSLELIYGFGVQIVWLLAFGLLYRIMWQKGLKNYSAYGG